MGLESAADINQLFDVSAGAEVVASYTPKGGAPLAPAPTILFFTSDNFPHRADLRREPSQANAWIRSSELAQAAVGDVFKRANNDQFTVRRFWLDETSGLIWILEVAKQ